MAQQPSSQANLSRVRWTLAGIVVLVFVAASISWPKAVPSFIPGSSWFNSLNLQLGLDLQGGTHLVYDADVSGVDGADQRDALEGVRDVIERRVNAYGVSEPVVQTSRYGDSYRVIVELAGVQDVSEAIRLIGETPLLEFKEVNPAAPTSTEVSATTADSEVQVRALGVLQRVLGGEDFAALANELSEDPGSRGAGGDIGWSKRSDLVPEYSAVAFDPSFEDGKVWPELVRTQFGYHIIKKLEARSVGSAREVRTAHILFRTADPTAAQWLNTELTGKYLRSSRVEFDQTTGEPHVALEFDSEGKRLFGEITARNIGKPVAIFLDGLAMSTPSVQSAITEGRAIITGGFSIQEAKLLARRLNAGALPVPINLVSQQTVGATLGQESVQRSLVAGLLGLLAVVLFMLLYYRLPGLVAVLALGCYAVLSLAVFEAWPITLTLVGIAGFILSIGMAVDANVLIFERLREELRNGKSFSAAVEEGFRRAWLAIRDSNVSSLITCAILAWFGTGLVKGFAITLGIGIIISMFSAITITRTLLRLVPARWFERHRWLIGI